MVRMHAISSVHSNVLLRNSRVANACPIHNAHKRFAGGINRVLTPNTIEINVGFVRTTCNDHPHPYRTQSRSQAPVMLKCESVSTLTGYFVATLDLATLRVL